MNYGRNHVKFARFVSLPVSEELTTSADNPYLDLDYSKYHKNLIQ